MPIVVNSNNTATVASFNLSRANDSLRTSLARLSSGKRIVNPSDDAGGLSVANKLASKLERTEAVRQNIQNGISYLQVQDGALSTLAKVVDRMAELRTMASDITKNEGDIENYSKEFLELQKQLNQMYHEKFNGISLFSMSRSERLTNPPDLRPTLDKNNLVKDSSGRGYQSFSRNIVTTADGLKQDGNISLNTVNLQYMLSLGGLDTTFITKTAAAILAAQQSNTEQTGNTDGNGQRSFINIGNVNGANSDDWTDNTASYKIIDEIYNNDDATDAEAYAAGPLKVGDYVKHTDGNSYKVIRAADAWNETKAATGYARNDVVFNSKDGAYYELNANSLQTPEAWDATTAAAGTYALNDIVYNSDDGKYYQAAAAITATPTGPAFAAATAFAGTDVIVENGKFYKTLNPAGYTSAGGATWTTDQSLWQEIEDPAKPGHADSDANWNALAGNPAAFGHADTSTDWVLLNNGGAGDGTLFTDLQAATGSDIFEEAAKFTTQTEVNAYMKNEVYTEDNLIKSIMFVDMATFNDLIERVADARAENGAEQNRLGMINELLTQNQTNLEAAHGRIMDADVALESTRFARQNVLVQSSAAMVAQANQLTNIALTILG